MRLAERWKLLASDRNSSTFSMIIHQNVRRKYLKKPPVLQAVKKFLKFYSARTFIAVE
jgi:hypothetical protein